MADTIDSTSHDTVVLVAESGAITTVGKLRKQAERREK